MRYLLITLTICIGLMLGCNSKNNSKTEVVTSEEIIAEEQNSNSETQEYIEEANHLEYDPSKTLYFSHAFIYKYTDEDESKEFFHAYFKRYRKICGRKQRRFGEKCTNY